MNKETRIFIAGFFYYIIGCLTITMVVIKLVEDGLFWWEYVFFIPSFYVCWHGHKMMKKANQ
jgi:hypothetical protein